MRKGQSTLERLARGHRKDMSNGKQGHFAPRGGMGGKPHLRPPVPEGANRDPQQDFIPAGRRGVANHPSRAANHLKVPARLAAMAAQHKNLAHEVAGGLRNMSFKRVGNQMPGVGAR